MRLGFALTSVLALALGSAVYAASGQTSERARSEKPTISQGLPLSWAPDWLMRPLSRAIADATDPRPRSKETGAPVD